ncbi:nuclear transport factor 2 family protein [Sphingobium sp. H39-3-25]|uniref:nuclear transport factor 2 family protein n=1 Tax=Sphingobium arseniciresistens TaxID=3030834 RepID=UPI0023B9D1BE|nr:nuclear transport factor 2 family protein [Sphingobium arseniciresistens]
MMIKTILALAAVTLPQVVAAQAQADQGFARRLHLLEDKSQLRELLDRFNDLADRKEVDAASLLLAEEAVATNYEGDKLVGSPHVGRADIRETFRAYLNSFEVAYHLHGQSIFTVTGDTATGITYGSTVMIRNDQGKRTKFTSGLRYQDGFVRRGGKWLIATRQSHVLWREANQIENMPSMTGK